MILSLIFWRFKDWSINLFYLSRFSKNLISGKICLIPLPVYGQQKKGCQKTNFHFFANPLFLWCEPKYFNLTKTSFRIDRNKKIAEERADIMPFLGFPWIRCGWEKTVVDPGEGEFSHGKECKKQFPLNFWTWEQKMKTRNQSWYLLNSSFPIMENFENFLGAWAIEKNLNNFKS